MRTIFKRIHFLFSFTLTPYPEPHRCRWLSDILLLMLLRTYTYVDIWHPAFVNKSAKIIYRKNRFFKRCYHFFVGLVRKSGFLPSFGINGVSRAQHTHTHSLSLSFCSKTVHMHGIFRMQQCTVKRFAKDWKHVWFRWHSDDKMCNNLCRLSGVYRKWAIHWTTGGLNCRCIYISWFFSRRFQCHFC